MIEKELEKIVREEKQRGSSILFIQNALKEYLQAPVLFFIYTSSQYRKNFIFTGGTCLRHFYNLQRFSVDLDFDVQKPIESEQFLADISRFFSERYQFDIPKGGLKQKGKQLILKFPLLKKFGLAHGHESDLLYVRIDLSPIPSKNFTTRMTSKNLYGLNFVARHYDLPDLMAGKLHAILTRKYFRGEENRQSIKGRDYFDLLWFLKKGVRPNLERLSEMLERAVTPSALEIEVTEKVNQFLKNHLRDFRADMIPLLREQEILTSYIEHYRDEFHSYKSQSFDSIVRLMVVCRRCQKRFASGITMFRSVFESSQLENKHLCPHCGYENKVDKSDYVMEI